MTSTTVELAIDRECADCGRPGLYKPGQRCQTCVTGEAPDEPTEVTVTEVTIKLTAAKLVSLQKAMAAIDSIVEDTPTVDGYAATVKLKTFFDVAEDVEAIKSLFRNHRGVKAEVTTKATVKDIESYDADHPTWENSPMAAMLNKAA